MDNFQRIVLEQLFYQTRILGRILRKLDNQESLEELSENVRATTKKLVASIKANQP